MLRNIRFFPKFTKTLLPIQYFRFCNNYDFPKEHTVVEYKDLMMEKESFKKRIFRNKYLNLNLQNLLKLIDWVKNN